MAESLPRRKYSRLVRYLTDVMEDEQMSTRTRMAAAFRLDDIYARNETRADRAREKQYKRQLAEIDAMAPKEAAQALETAIADMNAEVPNDVDIQRVFDSVLKRTPGSISIDADTGKDDDVDGEADAA